MAGPVYDVRLTLEELRWRRDAVGCVGPAKEGSLASRSPAAAEVVDEAVDATEAVCARRALNSRVRRLTLAKLARLLRAAA